MKIKICSNTIKNQLEEKLIFERNLLLLNNSYQKNKITFLKIKKKVNTLYQEIFIYKLFFKIKHYKKKIINFL